MIIKTTVTLEYRLDDSKIEEFRNKVLEYIQDELEEDGEEVDITLDDIPIKKVKEYLNRELPNVIAEMKDSSYGGWGIELDTYFNSISFNFYDGDVIRDMVQECADEIKGVNELW